jgi:hypothetical protein
MMIADLIPLESTIDLGSIIQPFPLLYIITMRLPTHLITTVLAMALSMVVAQEPDVELRQLTDGDFRASTARGLW